MSSREGRQITGYDFLLSPTINRFCIVLSRQTVCHIVKKRAVFQSQEHGNFLFHYLSVQPQLLTDGKYFVLFMISFSITIRLGEIQKCPILITYYAFILAGFYIRQNRQDDLDLTLSGNWSLSNFSSNFPDLEHTTKYTPPYFYCMPSINAYFLVSSASICFASISFRVMCH